MPDTICPHCGEINIHALEYGATDGPREYHAECWLASRQTLRQTLLDLPNDDYAELREAYYQAIEGLRKLNRILDEQDAKAFDGEKCYARTAEVALDCSNLGTFI